MKFIGLMVVGIACSACGSADFTSEPEDLAQAQQELSVHDFNVDYSNCAEFAGIGLVPAANAQPLVPSGFTLATSGSNAIVVVRVASCAGAVVDGKKVGRTITSQVGIKLVGPDASADINNYPVFFATNQALLHARFQGIGASSDKSDDLSLTLANGSLTAESESSHSSPFEVRGPAAVPTAAPTTFAASWWAKGKQGIIRSRTTFPAIQFGTATTTLVTEANTTLSKLFGGRTLTFAFLDSYNTFASSHLEVRDTD
jgi:hypothetical protein